VNDTATARYVLDRILIEDLPKRYSHGIDERDWAKVDSCFAVDAQIRGTSFEGPYPEYIVSLRRGVESFGTTMHFLGDQLTEIDGDTGRIVTYGIAYHLASATPGGDFVVGVRYVDDVGRAGDGWVIKARVVHPIWRQGFGEEMHVISPSSIAHRGGMNG
jgi:hypothetical protein